MSKLPNGWELARIEDLASVKDGTHSTPTYTENGIPFLRVTDVRASASIDLSAIKYIAQEEHEQLIKRCCPRKGDILYSKNGTIGVPRVVTWDWEFSIFVSLALIRVQKKDRLDTWFFYHYLDSDLAKHEIYRSSKQGTVTNLHLEEIRKFQIPLPPLAEQRKIAEILSTWDEAIQLVESLIATLKGRKRGLMQRLLTGEVRFPGFAGEWEEVRLGDVVALINGKAFKPDDWETDGLPIIRIQNLNGSDEYNYSNQIVEDKYYVNTGDLLFSWSGSRGTSFGPHIWNGPKGILNQHIFRIEIHSDVTRDYLYYILKYITTLIEQRAHGSAGLVHVTKRELERFAVPVFDLEEQESIARVLSFEDDHIRCLGSYSTVLREQKKGLMQRLLTGEVRV